MSTQSQNLGNIARQVQQSQQNEANSRSVSQGHSMNPTASGARRHPQVPHFQSNPKGPQSFPHPVATSLQHSMGHLPSTGPRMNLPNISPRPSTSSVCPPYEAGYKAALEHLHELMRKGHVPKDNWKRSEKPDSEDGDEDSTNYFTPATENMGSASVGLPSPCIPSIDSPLLTPPELPLFAGVHHRIDDPMRANSSTPDWTSSPPASGSLSLSENRDASRRTIQQRAYNSYAQHKKQNSGAKFRIQTDAAGNIIANKLRVTSLVNSLMERYVDVAQIHYDDDDERFKVVEDDVRDVFEFEPPLKDNWFPIYMRKKLEKNRSEFRKHWEDKGERHPKCTPKKHVALLSWWNSPAGASKSTRISQMNTDRATKRRELSLRGIQNQQKGMPRIGATSESLQGIPTPEDGHMFDLPNSGSRRSSSAGEVQVFNFMSEPDIPDELLDNQPLKATGYKEKQRPIIGTPPRLNQVESDVADLKSNVSEILQRLIVYEGFPKVMEELLQTIKGQGDRTADAPFNVAGEGSHVNFSAGNFPRHIMKDKAAVSCAAADGNDSTTRELSSKEKGVEETCLEEDLTVNDDKSDDVYIDDQDPLTVGEVGGSVAEVAEETETMSRSRGSDDDLNCGKFNPDIMIDETMDTVHPAEVQVHCNSATNGVESIKVDHLKTPETMEKKPTVVIPEVTSENLVTNEWITVVHNPGSIVEDIPRKGKRKAVKGVEGQSSKRSSKFEETQPPNNLSPNGHQKKYPVPVNKNVWVIHPTRPGDPVALGRTNYSFKTTKSKLQSSQWSSLKWEVGMQLVEIIKVYQPAVKVMHPTKQPNKNVKTLDDVRDTQFSEESIVMWGSEYLILVKPANVKGKLK